MEISSLSFPPRPQIIPGDNLPVNWNLNEFDKSVSMISPTHLVQKIIKIKVLKPPSQKGSQKKALMMNSVDPEI